MNPKARRRCVQPKISALVLTAFTLVCVYPGEAQQTVKVYRIGILNYGRGNPALESFRRSLRDLGYVEAQNIVLEYRWAKNEDQLAALAAELLRVNVDIIVATNPRGSRVAQKLTKSVPIIVTAMNDPVGFGLVKSLHRPGGNVTGLSFMSTELDGKRLELLAETIHGLSSVGILAAGPQRPPLKELHTVASTLNVQLQVVNVNEPEEIENVLRAVSRHAGALQVLSHAMLLINRARVVNFAAKLRMPAVYHRREYVEAGGLMSYGPDHNDLYRRGLSTWIRF